ncbi:hypothetical protein CC2G_014435 [Coprinopsis cinerea AmutBmut pab1-1]|nr:hypothetical protein CC2G_014435 [Coprinopsis cinerea AmutBmut pab1-1]
MDDGDGVQSLGHQRPGDSPYNARLRTNSPLSSQLDAMNVRRPQAMVTRSYFMQHVPVVPTHMTY